MSILDIAQKTIQLYRLLLSPDHSLLRGFFPCGACRFHPSCSQYMEQAISKYAWRGVWLGIKRIFKCHPFTKGGHDPLI